MFNQLRMELSAPDLNIHKGSVLQGVLFDYLEKDYADYLHQQRLHPYSQSLAREQEHFYWTINTLNDEAFEQIIRRFASPSFRSFRIKRGNIDVTITEKQSRVTSNEILMSEFYDTKGPRSITFQMKTPASFKQNGRYVTLPDLRLIYQSLMNKYSACSENLQMFDTDTLEQMLQFSAISRYRLFSAAYSLEGVRIPGFMGTVTISFYGNDTVARYVRLLLRFGEFSGIGIKTAMGMGAVSLAQQEN